MKNPAYFLLGLGLLMAPLPAVYAQTSAPKGSLADIGFIEGHWKGTTSQGTLEAVWSAPAGDNVVGFIRMMQGEKATLYELFAFEQTQQGPVALVKHFKPGLIGLEEKDSPDRYTFLEASPGRALFEKQGESMRVRYEKRAPDQMVIAVGKLQQGQWVFQDLFTFNRVK